MLITYIWSCLFFQILLKYSLSLTCKYKFPQQSHECSFPVWASTVTPGGLKTFQQLKPKLKPKHLNDPEDLKNVQQDKIKALCHHYICNTFAQKFCIIVVVVQTVMIKEIWNIFVDSSETYRFQTKLKFKLNTRKIFLWAASTPWASLLMHLQ